MSNRITQHNSDERRYPDLLLVFTWFSVSIDLSNIPNTGNSDSNTWEYYIHSRYTDTRTHSQAPERQYFLYLIFYSKTNPLY